MTPLEDALKKALRREEPPADFTARVLARCVQPPARKAWFPGWLAVPASAAALLALAWTGETMYQNRQRQVRGQAAKQQLLVAMRLAGSKLQAVQRRLAENTEVDQ